jgi:hypothetical protein
LFRDRVEERREVSRKKLCEKHMNLNFV